MDANSIEDMGVFHCMRLMLVYYYYDDAGSAQDIHNYTRVAKELGHEICVYGPDDGSSPFNCSLDIDAADAVVFIFEWTTKLRSGGNLDLIRLMEKVPRNRRIVIDCDGGYNDGMMIEGDYNHKSERESRRWIEVCDSLSDKVCQPTLHPLRANVWPFFFHAYDPDWEQPLEFDGKDYGMVYVGHSKFRWHPMHRILQAIEVERDRVGRIAIVGHGWDAMPSWAADMEIEDTFYTDPDYLNEMKVEFVAPVHFRDVIPWMSKAVFNPVIYRPLFRRLWLVTCRTFETPAASTIPLFDLDETYVREIYGESATELVVREGDSEKILNVVQRPQRYVEVVEGIRDNLSRNHSYRTRLEELVEIARS